MFVTTTISYDSGTRAQRCLEFKIIECCARAWTNIDGYSPRHSLKLPLPKTLYIDSRPTREHHLPFQDFTILSCSLDDGDGDDDDGDVDYDDDQDDDDEELVSSTIKKKLKIIIYIALHYIMILTQQFYFQKHALLRPEPNFCPVISLVAHQASSVGRQVCLLGARMTHGPRLAIFVHAVTQRCRAVGRSRMSMCAHDTTRVGKQWLLR